MSSQDNNKALIWLGIVGIALGILCVVLILVFLKDSGSTKVVSEENNAGKNVIEIENDRTQADVNTENKNPDEPASIANSEDKFAQYNIPNLKKTVAEWSAQNPDIYAVVSLPGCQIEEAVCQRADDEFYYSSHNELGTEDINGCVYTQVFNTKSFDDNLTVMYGRNTGDGKRFSNLHYYEDPEFMNDYPYIYVYTDKRVLVYEIFGAYRYEALHLIVAYNTNTEQGYNNYMVAISEIEPGINDNFRENVSIDPRDKMLTLSTGITGEEDYRYLVQGMLVDEISINE